MPQPLPYTPLPPQNRNERRGHAAAAIAKLLSGPGNLNRVAIEAHLVNVQKFTQVQVNEALVDMYDECVKLGLLNAR